MTELPLNKINLDEFWPYHVAFLADQISRHTLSLVKQESELNTSQWRVLAAVVDKPGRSSADVTAITPMDKTIVSRAVSSLIEGGIIDKKRSDADKRILLLSPTKAGLDIYSRITQRLTQSLSSNKETDALMATLKDYIKMMDDISD